MQVAISFKYTLSDKAIFVDYSHNLIVRLVENVSTMEKPPTMIVADTHLAQIIIEIGQVSIPEDASMVLVVTLSVTTLFKERTVMESIFIFQICNKNKKSDVTFLMLYSYLCNIFVLLQVLKHRLRWFKIHPV